MSNEWVYCVTDLDGTQACGVQYHNGPEVRKLQAVAKERAQGERAAQEQAQQKVRDQQQQLEAQAKAAKDAKAQALADKYRVDGWIPWTSVTANAYAHEGKVYMIKTVFERMLSPDSAQFGDGMISQAVLITGVPKTAFTERKDVVVVGRVLEPDKNVRALKFKYVGHEFCRERSCSEFGSIDKPR